MKDKTVKVAIIGSVGVPAKYGGFETLADKLVEHLANKFSLTVYCSGLQYSKRLNSYKGAALEYVEFSANGVQSVFYDIISIKRAVKEHDVLLILGVAGMFYIPWVKFFRKNKVILHIDGMEWKRDKWKWFAKSYLKYSEKLGILFADRVIADNAAILKNVPKRYHKKTDLIAYGADHVQFETVNEKLLKRLEIPFRDYSFSVCRIVPENNIRIILQAFKESKKNLVLVGNWYDSNYGIDIWREFHQLENIALIHPIYNQKELDALRCNCSFYIHGHSAGGTNPSLVEAMALGLKIIAFNVDFNCMTLNNNAWFFSTKEELLELLNEKEYPCHLVTESKKMVELNYRWEGVTAKYASLIEKLN
ncbi:MAG: DUF1972 domain-containing protein [Vicingaceae bacterium]